VLPSCAFIYVPRKYITYSGIDLCFLLCHKALLCWTCQSSGDKSSGIAGRHDPVKDKTSGEMLEMRLKLARSPVLGLCSEVKSARRSLRLYFETNLSMQLLKL
jgi:hypothetical protein